MKEAKQLELIANHNRKRIVEMVYRAGVGHVGGALSVIDLLTAIYENEVDFTEKKRTRVVLSKGHAGPVMYATLGLKGFYPVSDAYQLNQPGTIFPSHTDRNKTPGVDLTTGSLGQGIGEAVGAALGLKTQGKNSRVYVAVGDGESDEGAVWEAAQFAAHYKLDNLICFVDDNKRQLDGAVDKVMSHGKGIAAKFDAFGWNVITVADGNDVEQIYDAVADALKVKNMPSCIVLNTIKGKGATFAESTGAHSSQPSKEEWDEAIAAAEARYAAVKGQN